MKHVSTLVLAVTLGFSMTNAVNASNLNTNKVLSDKITDIETAAKEDLANGDDAARFENPTAP